MDKPGIISRELESEAKEVESGSFGKVIAAAMTATRQGGISPDLLRGLARYEDETLQYYIRRMSDPNLSQSEEASLARLLQKAGLIQKLVDTLLVTDRRSAATVAGVLQRTERWLDRRLAAHVQSENPSVVMRSLELLEAIDVSKQLVPILFGLLSHSDPKIKSKAALVVQKLDNNFVYTQRLLRHSDARVRANAVEALAGRADARAHEFLLQGAGDPDHRVRSLAAVGLCRVGNPLGRQLLFRMIQDPSVIERRSAAWALGMWGTFECLQALESAARDDVDIRVRELAAEGIQRIRERAALQSAEYPKPRRE